MGTKVEPRVDRDAVRLALARRFFADRLAACCYHANGQIPGDDEIVAIAVASVAAFDPKAGEAEALQLLASLP